MSLLDDVSIVITPNAYNVGELYAVIPVPTEGAELVTNGEFATDTDWSKQTGWTISGGTANYDFLSDAKYIRQTLLSGGFVVGKTYKINFEVTSGSAYMYFNSNGGSLISIATYEIGSYSIEVSPANNGSDILIYGRNTSGTAFSITNVSVKEYTSADMDVTRETAATRVDENGLVNYAEVLGGEEVDDGDFANGETDWTFSAQCEVVNNQARILSTDGSFQYISQNNVFDTGKNYKLEFDIISSNGATLGLGGGIPDVQTTTLGRKTIYTSSSVSYLQIKRSSGVTDVVIDNISVKEVTRDNVPRIDYTGGGCPHILAEPMRTNLIQYSEDFSQSYWTKSGATVESGNISPDGTANAFKLVEDTSTGNHYVKSGGFSATSGLDYTFSAYFKKGENNFIQLIPSGAFGSLYANFDLLNGVVGSLSTGTSTIELVGEYYRCSFTVAATSTSSTAVLFIWKIQSATSVRAESYTGDGTSGVYIWGGQVEEGSYSTSYIPNFGTALGVTRNQDIFTRDGIGSLINSTEGVLFLEMAALSDDGSYRQFSITDGTVDNRIIIRYTPTSNQINAYLYNGSVQGGQMDFTLTDSTVFSKIAYKWKVNDFALWVDGVEVVTSSSGTTFSIGTLNKLNFDYSGAYFLNAKVKQLQVYDTALTDEQLLQLTGLPNSTYSSYLAMANALNYTIQ